MCQAVIIDYKLPSLLYTRFIYLTGQSN